MFVAFYLPREPSTCQTWTAFRMGQLEAEMAAVGQYSAPYKWRKHDMCWVPLRFVCPEYGEFSSFNTLEKATRSAARAPVAHAFIENLKNKYLYKGCNNPRPSQWSIVPKWLLRQRFRRHNCWRCAVLSSLAPPLPSVSWLITLLNNTVPRSRSSASQHVYSVRPTLMALLSSDPASKKYCRPLTYAMA